MLFRPRVLLSDVHHELGLSGGFWLGLGSVHEIFSELLVGLRKNEVDLLHQVIHLSLVPMEGFR